MTLIIPSLIGGAPSDKIQDGLGTTKVQTLAGSIPITISGTELGGFFRPSGSFYAGPYQTAFNLHYVFTSIASGFPTGVQYWMDMDLAADAAIVPAGLEVEFRQKAGNTHNLTGINGITGTATHYGSGAVSYINGLYGAGNVMDGGGSCAELRGLVCNAYAQGAVTVGNAEGIIVYGTGAWGGATIANNYQIFIDAPYVGAGGAIGASYGLYILDQSSAGSATHYNLYSIGTGANLKHEGQGYLGKLFIQHEAQMGAFTVATLPAGLDGYFAFASDGRKAGEGAGAGTGSMVVYSNGAWRRLSDETVIAA